MELLAMSDARGSAGNVIAALASVFVPGLGQLIQGRPLAAIAFFGVCTVCYFLWFLIVTLFAAVLVHLWCILDAARWQPDR